MIDTALRSDSMIVTKDLSRKISAFSFVCALLIVTLHWYADFSAGTFGYFVYTVIRRCASIAVPFFCVASGFFLAGHMGECGWWKQAVRKRMRTLLIPFFIWNLLAWLFFIGLHYVARIVGFPFAQTYVTGITCSRICSWFGLNIFNYPLHGHYWYVRMLFLFVVVSPAFLVCRSRAFGAVAIILQLIALVFFNRLNNGGNWAFFWEWTFPLRCLLFLSAGIWLRFNAVSIPKQLSIGLLLLGIALLFLIGAGVHIGPELELLKTISLLIGLWSVFDWRMPAILASCSFPIYTLHWFGTRLIQLPLMAIGGGYDAVKRSLPAYLACLLVVEILTLVTALAMRRFLPRFSRFVFGR